LIRDAGFGIVVDSLVGRLFTTAWTVPEGYAMVRASPEEIF